LIRPLGSLTWWKKLENISQNSQRGHEQIDGRGLLKPSRQELIGWSVGRHTLFSGSCNDNVAFGLAHDSIAPCDIHHRNDS
jgi:hypothetical protein